MPDGCQLAARIWMPADAADSPVPAILEYIPYRKRDFMAVRDSRMHRYFAAHGYVSVRVDLRGSGDSTGVLEDEYLERELEDGRTVLAWIAAQPWCSGKVGMLGLSWGGFNGLQMAALDPPELGAVISVCASDDRYGDDVHYMGGCLLTDNLSWASVMFSFNSCPPDPQLMGEGWRDQWIARLEGSGLWMKNWLEHQRRDAFWKHASVCEDYSAIKCPVFIASGWMDGYSDTVFRLLEHLDVPCKGLVGAWGHKYPQYGALGEAIGFLSESVRWWDRWLKGIENGVDDDPALTFWMQDTVAPTLAKRPGRWAAESNWPTERVASQSYYLNPGKLVPVDGGGAIEGEQTLQSPLSVGLFAGKWMSLGTPADIPSDQREEDGGAMIFETEPHTGEIQMLGQPRVELVVSADEPQAMVAVRLSDVAPDGKATRISFGLLNLAHRDGDESPTPLEPGRRYRVSVPLNRLGQRLPAGNRLRLSISTSYWPLAWPSPRPFSLTVHTGQSRIELPIRAPSSEDRKIKPPSARESGSPLRTTLLEPARREWKVVHDLASNESYVLVVNEAETRRIDEYDWTFGASTEERYSYTDYRYDTLRAEVRTERRFSRGDWRAHTVTHTVLTSDENNFFVRATLDAYEGDSRIFARSWDEVIPRDHL